MNLAMDGSRGSERFFELCEIVESTCRLTVNWSKFFINFNYYKYNYTKTKNLNYNYMKI